MCICSTSNPARNAHVPYWHLLPFPLYNIFPHYLINGTISEKKTILNLKFVFFFFYNVSLQHFSFEAASTWKFSFSDELSENWSKGCTGFHMHYTFIFSDFSEIWIFFADFRKIFKYQTQRKSVQWQQSCSMRTEGQTQLSQKSLFTIFRKPQ